MGNKIVCNTCRGTKVYQVSNLEFEECNKCKGKGYVVETDEDLKGEILEKKKLSEFLKEKGAYESFIENCLNNKWVFNHIMNNSLTDIGIFMGLTWANTPQGKEYWSNLLDEANIMEIIYDMDEILYKEYEKNPITKDIVENGEEDKVMDSKQEFQTIILDGVEYHLVPKEVSVGYIKNWYDKDIEVETVEEYLKRKFEENKGQYEVLFKEKKSKEWSFCYRPNDLSWRKDWDYKLIKKEHKEIIEAYLKDSTLKVQYRWHDEDWMLLEDFIENYDENMQLNITKKEFEPFILSIEVNTIDEAKSLWNIFNLSYDAVNETIQNSLCKHYSVKHKNSLDCYYYWKQLDNVLKDLGEKPKYKK